jgi:uncharacterized protein (DUF1778 family)
MYADMAYISASKEEDMTDQAGLKRDRMHLRLDAGTKRRLQRAAAYEQTSVSEFVLSNAVSAAERVIGARETVALSGPDWDAFHDALVNPPAPNRVLRKAVARFRERVGE